jgi:hypothetical protein
MREPPDPVDWREAVRRNEATLADADLTVAARVLREGLKGLDSGRGGEASVEWRE